MFLLKTGPETRPVDDAPRRRSLVRHHPPATRGPLGDVRFARQMKSTTRRWARTSGEDWPCAPRRAQAPALKPHGGQSSSKSVCLANPQPLRNAQFGEETPVWGRWVEPQFLHSGTDLIPRAIVLAPRISCYSVA